MRIIIKDIRHWQFKKDILNLSVLTLVTVLFWIGFELHHTYSQSTVEPDVQNRLTPLDPSIDNEVIDSLQFRATQTENFTPVITSSSAPSPSIEELGLTLEATPPATASPSAQPQTN